MKKYFKKLFLLISILLILAVTACSGTENQVVDENENLADDKLKADSVNESLLDSDEDVSPEMAVFLKILTPDASTAELKNYIEENIQHVSQKEAEKMIEVLLIYQTEAIADFQITEDFFHAVYDDINESLIESFSNQNLKSGYKKLLDSSLVLRSSDSDLYVERDWESLKKFSSYLPEYYEKVFDLYTKLRSYEYNPDVVDVTSLGQDIIATETTINKNPYKIFRKIRDQLYQAQLYTLLLGPEASHVYFWSDKASTEYNQLIDFSDQYPKSIFSKIINEIDNTFMEDTSDLTKIIEKHLAFGLDSKNYIETLNYSENNAEYTILQIKIPDNKEKENKINEIINMDINNYIEEENIDDILYLSMDLKHADQQYISYEIYLEYKDLQGNEDSKYFYRNLDYSQEKYITLEGYLGASFDLIKPELERILAKELDSYPEFILYSDEISLFSYNQEGGTDHIGSLNLKDIFNLRPSGF